MTTDLRIFKPPQHLPNRAAAQIFGLKSVFLAGSIDLGVAVDWQAYATGKLLEDTRMMVLNPRRDNWDWSIEQRMHNPAFKEQVDWELDGLDHADAILMHFDKDSKSVITLLELGLCADTDNLVISCPDGFYRKGNVEIVADRYGIPLYDNLDAAIQHVKDNV